MHTSPLLNFGPCLRELNAERGPIITDFISNKIMSRVTG